MDLRLFILGLCILQGFTEVIHIDINNFETIRGGDKTTLMVITSEDKGTGEIQNLEDAFRQKEVESRLYTVALATNRRTNILSLLRAPEREGIFLIKGKTTFEYFGLRNPEDIADWTLRKQGALLIKQSNEMPDLIDKNTELVVGFFSSQDSEKAKIYNDVAAQTNDIQLYIVTDPGIMMKFSQGDGSILLLKSNEEKDVIFSKEITKESLLQFIKQESFPLVTPFSREHASKVMKSERMVHLLLVSDSDDKDHGHRMEAMRTVAKNYRNKIIFIYVDLIPESTPILDLFKVSVNQIPALFIYDMQTGYRYRKTGQISVSTINQFITDFQEGNLKRILLSGRLPENDDQQPVKTLVSLNYMDAVSQTDRVLFLMAYAPWSDECKQLANEWSKLGDQFQNDDRVIIAKMDIIGNEILSTSIETYPAIAWVPRNKTDIHIYQGKKSFESLKMFITKKASAEDDDDDDDDDDDYDDGYDEEEEEDETASETTESTTTPPVQGEDSRKDRDEL